MISISKSVKFIAFSFAVILSNYSFAQYYVASPEVISYGNPMVGFQAPQWGYNSIPLASQQYSVGYVSGVSLPVSTHDATFFQSSIPYASMPQNPIQPYFEGQTYGHADSTIVIHSKDVGYLGPGDMRTHLWKHHASDLQANGISEAALASMPMPIVQKWHNYFHGTEAAPSDH